MTASAGSSLLGRIAAVLGFQAVWLACALGAAQGTALPGLVASAAFVAARLITSAPSTGLAITAAASAVIGAIAETLLAWTGVVTHAAPWPGSHIAPAWIIALWLAFGAALGPVRALLGTSPPWLVSLAGGAAGAAAYYAGHRLAALHLSDPLALGIAAVTALWAVALPVLLKFDAYLERGGVADDSRRRRSGTSPT